MSFDPKTDEEARQLSTEELLEKILEELRLIRKHMEQITDEEIEEDDID